MIYPVILAGGKGERFWPYSNRVHPKQLLPLVSRKTMLEDTLEHISRLKTDAPVHIIASKNLEAPMRKLLGERKEVVLVGEPVGRDTAPAIALACRLIHQHDPKGVMTVLTAGSNSGAPVPPVPLAPVWAVWMVTRPVSVSKNMNCPRALSR